MLDTLISQIPISYFSIIEHNRFKPSTVNINERMGFFKCVSNPTETDKKKYGYLPRLTVIKRGRQLYLKVEFSAPKLLFGNNLDELEESDFESLINKLQKTMLIMGIRLFSEEIENAEVLGFHPSKNIQLSRGYTSSFAIRELNKINPSKLLDLEKISFRNAGEALQIYSNRHSCVFYDKINDLNKPPKRALEENKEERQISLFNRIKKEKRDIELLRFEVRLSNIKKMKEVLRGIGFKDTPLLKNIFKKELCQTILLLYWNKFFNKNLFLFSTTNNPQKILQTILAKYPKMKVRKAIAIVGLLILCKDEEGIRGLKNITKNYEPKHNWATVERYLEKLDDEVFITPTHGFIKDIEKSLNEFEPFKLKRSA